MAVVGGKDVRFRRVDLGTIHARVEDHFQVPQIQRQRTVRSIMHDSLELFTSRRPRSVCCPWRPAIITIIIIIGVLIVAQISLGNMRTHCRFSTMMSAVRKWSSILALLPPINSCPSPGGDRSSRPPPTGVDAAADSAKRKEISHLLHEYAGL
jgi:hypothetical protein